MSVTFTYYKFNNPGFPISDWDYLRVKAISDNGKRIDFYGYVSIFNEAKGWLIVDAIPLLIVLLLNVKVYFLQTEGALKVLDFMYGALAIVLFASALPLLSLLIVWIRAIFYNNRLNSLLRRTQTYHQWEDKYYRRKAFK
ncbi:hypothetical protein [Mucilaginibacter sp. HD30]